MNIFIYSDESGVFDKAHNEYFIFGGLILINSDAKELWSRKYSHVEKILRENKGVSIDYELKATQVTNKEKGELFRSLNECYKFGVVIKEQKVWNEFIIAKRINKDTWIMRTKLQLNELLKTLSAEK